MSENGPADPALLDQLALLSATLDNMDQGLIVIDAQRRLPVVSRRAIELLDLPAEMMASNPLYDDVLALQVARGEFDHVDPSVRAFVASGGLDPERVSIIEYTRPNGVALEIRTVPLRDGSAVCTYTDITARRRAEDDLRKKTMLLDATLENMDQGLMMIDERSVVRVCNERAIALLDLPPDMMRHQPSFEEVRQYQLDRDDFVRSGEAMRRWVANSGMEREAHTYERERPNGTVLEIRTVPLRDGGAVRTYTDVTERKQSEAKLAASEERLRFALAAGRMYAWERDRATGTVVRTGDVARVLGLAPDTAGSGSFDQFIACVHPADRARVQEATNAAFTLGAPYAVEFRYRRPDDGEEVWLADIGLGLTSEAGVRLFGVCSDVTERKVVELALAGATAEAEEARRHAEAASQAKTEFLASMSHEIRTPLNGILGYADLLLDDPGLTPEQRRHVDRVQAAGTALLTIVNDILDFAKIEAGQVELEQQPFSPRAMTDNAVSIVHALAAKKSLSLKVELDTELPHRLVGDEDRLRQVLLNLLNNAIKFTPRGEVTVRVAAPEGEGAERVLRVTVADTGIGIPRDKLARLFQRFSQVDGSVRREFGGTGLGLAISKRLIELMRGEIGFESREGIGSTFHFAVALPIAEDEALVLGANQARQASRPLRVLLAEDNEINQEIAKAVLEAAGHSVGVVSDGAEAVMAVQAEAYDAVLMDVQMPVMDGIAATRHIRDLDCAARHVPIIALTANVLPQQMALFEKAGMNGHVGKPFRRDDLLAALDRAVQAARAENAAPPK